MGGIIIFLLGHLNYLIPVIIAIKNNRRGIGLDKPQLGSVGPTCGCLSMQSFGHSGFTGTYAWADPDKEIVYVFLANRTFPTSKVNRLLKENIRTEIQRFNLRINY